MDVAIGKHNYFERIAYKARFQNLFKAFFNDMQMNGRVGNVKIMVLLFLQANLSMNILM